MENKEGVEIDATQFGDVSTVYTLDTSFLGKLFSGYYRVIVNYLVKRGWRENEDIRAAPYDFRKIPLKKTLDEYFDNLKKLVENLHEERKCKVALITHSMGGPLARMFFAKQHQPWIEKHIGGWVSINGAFAGSKTAVLARTFGLFSWATSVGMKEHLKVTLPTFPGAYFLQPSNFYFGEDLPIAHTSTKNFTLKNMTIFQRQVIGANQHVMEQLDLPDIYPQTNFSVRFLCIYSTGHNTVAGALLDDDYNLEYSNIEYKDGDGILTAAEQMSCHSVAASMPRRRKRVRRLEGLDHLGVLKSETTSFYVEKFLRNLRNKVSKVQPNVNGSTSASPSINRPSR